MMKVMAAEVFGVAAQTWDAIGSIATAVGVLAAAAAAWFTWGQVKQSKAARLDQNRPYVVVTIERSRSMFELTDIVIRNVGAGPAHNVTIKVDPPLVRAVDTTAAPGTPGLTPLADVRYFNEPIPLMPPGYELVTFFDDSRERCDATPPLPERYTFTVSYDDGHGHEFPNEANIVDLGLTHDLLFTPVYTEHHIGQALRDIRSQLKQGPLLVDNVDARDARKKARLERMQRRPDGDHTT